MKKSLFILLALGALVVAGLAAFRVQTEVTTLTVVERAATDVITDTGDEGDSVGDILTFANEIYDEKNETMLGTDSGYCFRTAVGVGWECAWTIVLADGSISVQGPFYDASDSVLSITGGTGAYVGATGQMTLHARNDQGTEYDFIYEYTN